jgi:glycerol-3-phosphate acyltransferase PlsX
MPRPTLLLDAMGGDHAPDAPIRGAARLSLEAHVDMVVVGDEPTISERLAELEHNPERIAVHHASQVIEMGDNPEAAVETKPDASLLVAARLLGEGVGDALVTAGNTGALILACARHLELLPGIQRPALAAVYPTQLRRGSKGDPFSLILDVGATLEAGADDLVAYAVMGSAYARAISRNPRPRVALLSNGTEPERGLPAIVEAHRRLTRLPGIEFIGNIEGRDIPRGTADVVVTGGFVGNVVLKMLEGVAETVLDLARYAQKEKVKWRAGLFMLSSGIDKLKAITDWEQYGGAPILGFQKPVIKAHGRSGERAIVNAGKVAAKAVASRFDESIRAHLPTGS